MEELIESYLYKNNKCPLPEVGTLKVTNIKAVAWYAEKKIVAPRQQVNFSDAVSSPEDFISFIAERESITGTEAGQRLSKYCEKLKNLRGQEESLLSNTGRFFVNAEGILVFKAKEIPGLYMPPVHAEQVLHQEATHAMVVGDKETNSTEMAAYFAEAANRRKDNWWIYAIIFAVIGMAAFMFYLNRNGYRLNQFGNEEKIIPAVRTNTYQLTE